jgi:DUF1680 family protein
MGGVGEKFQVRSANDEGCSEADWLRLNLRLWKLTGETRFLDMAERLMLKQLSKWVSGTFWVLSRLPC